MFDELLQPEVWAAYLQHKTEAGAVPPSELARLGSYIEQRGYESVVMAMRAGRGCSVPVKKQINKAGSRKKRVVYSFSADEMWVLKLMAHLLHRYDHRLAQKCYSFRPGTGVHQAVRGLARTPGIGEMWCYKLDVADYFNSISPALLLPMVRAAIDDDDEVYGFLAALLGRNQAVVDGQVVYEDCGAMAGMPIAPFLANIYLRALDEHFTALGVLYARYSDDIIMFADTRPRLDEYRGQARAILAEYKLQVNPSKEAVSAPGQPWEFLGVAYCAGKIDISAATKLKMKAKIRRKARALRRWHVAKGVEPQYAVKATIKVFNRKFFGRSVGHDLTWARWFFPLVTQDDGLREIDQYLQQQLRTIASGRHTKKNFGLRYGQLKALGYRSLVSEFYRGRAGS